MPIAVPAAMPASGEGREEAGGAPYGTRTRVPALRGQCPRPLDEGSVAAETRVLLYRSAKGIQPGPLLLDPARITTTAAPAIIPRSQHPISRAHISGNALKVLYRLRERGYQAFLVGGGVRDLMLGREPKDFDVVTDARPDEVRKLFRNCRLIGRRFRLAHVHFGTEVVEVATFRAAPAANGDAEHGEVVLDESGRILRDNIYGSIAEDVWRRDFTANALYYNIADFSVWDYVDGVRDIESGTLRVIGDPRQRYQEDP